jgi:hypothetical protein
MRPYFTKSGKQQFKPSFAEIETMDWDGLGFCLSCGETQPAEPDARQYECDCCGERKVYGAAELALAGLYYTDSPT